MNTRKQLLAFVAVEALTMALGAPSAFAQSVPAPAPATSAKTDVVSELVVTATRRETNLKDTPIAITAVGAAAIEARGITDITQIQQAAPSLTLNGAAPISGNPSAVSAFIRGVGQIDFSSNTDPGVGVYLDGVYIARSVGALLDVADVERVEVLRGPQGTLFGRNTIGGAINVVSKQPTKTAGGFLSATTGSDNRILVNGAVNLPLGDDLFSSLDIFVHKRDGYVTRLGSGLPNLGDDNKVSGRGQLLWKPSDRFEALLSVDASTIREHGAGNVALSIKGTGGKVANAFNNAILGGVCSNGLPGGGIVAPAPAIVDTTKACFGAAYMTNDPYSTYATYPSKADTDVWGTALTMTWKLADTMSLKSITAFRDVNSTFGRDADQTPFNNTFTYNTVKQHQLSQELQVYGDAFGSKLSYLLGGYYFTEKAKDLSIVGGALIALSGLNLIQNHNFAVFGESTFNVTDRLHLTGGLRWTTETKEIASDQSVTGGILQPIGARLVIDPSEHSISAKEFSPRVTFSADLTDDLMGYVTYSKGFKSGGFNVRYTAPVAAPLSYRPEFLTLYEAGLKYQSPSRDLRLNGAVFYSDYKDIQIQRASALNAPQLGNITDNAAAGRIQGAELEGTWLPIGGLRFDAGVTYLDAKLTQIDPRVLQAGIPANARLVLVPKMAATGSVSYAFDLGDRGVLTPRADWSYRSSFFMDSANTPTLLQSAYSVVNLAVAYDTADRVWRATIGVTNVGDTHYLTSGIGSANAGLIEGVFARPREWYLSAKRSF